MSTQTRQYKQLTLGQRYQIEALLGTDLLQKEIADKVGITESTLSRELHRNASNDGYYAETAHALTTQRRASPTKFSKSNERHMPIIKKGLSLGWSPENISARMKVEVPEIALSHMTIYKRIGANKTQGGTLYKEPPRYGKRRCKGGKRKAGRFLIPNRVDISERPEVVELRSRLGDWEGDTVFGQDAHLVTLVDRKSRYTLIGKTDTKQAETVADTMINLLKRVSTVCIITLDNGGEFAAHEKVSKAMNADVFFAKPYASYQRGTNENTNGIIRRTWPKKIALGNLSEESIRETELLINTMPRKVLGGRTPLEVYSGVSIALIA
ncbi:IS30 family transposase [Endozoicomonas arenosclerae]|uniref:IS30 family transposase n=1 Tax=Endozoicomonas arenosclerae TaxID=1633495 RepID=UPI00078062FB|nr:IS30 family transposase [Endozoicomonas arenosclerae]